MNNQLIYDKPRSRGVENVIRRAHQLLDIVWSPRMELTVNSRKYVQSTRSGQTHSQPASYTGMPYSSSRILNRFAGLDITIDTFLTALDNPASILYTRDLSDFDEPAFNCTITNTFFTYGTVCSAFVNYSLGLPRHVSTHEWDSAPEFDLVANQSADGLELCDTLCTTRPNGRTGGHVRIVTGIGRDASGHVQAVEISESVQPFPICKWYTAGEFEKTLLGHEQTYQIFRYRHLDSVDYFPTRAELGNIHNPDLMLNHGDFSNYQTDEPVCFNIACDADTLFIDGVNSRRTIDIRDLAPTTVLGQSCRICTVPDLVPDHYIAYCQAGDHRSLPVNFNVVQRPDVTVTDAAGQAFPRIALKPVCPDGSPLTKDSPCFLDDTGKLSKGIVTIAVTDGNRIFPARAAVREKNGHLVVRTAAMFTDADGSILHSFTVGEDVTLYALGAAEGSVVHAAFTGAMMCTPSYLSWKEEAAISYVQHPVTPDELNAGCLDTKLINHGNAFGHFMIFCANEYGRISSTPITFIITDYDPA